MQLGKVFPGSVVVAGLLGLSGCDLLLGLDTPDLYPNSTVTVSTTSTETGGAGGDTTSGSNGGGGSQPCSDGDQLACYDGPVGTEAVGECKAGKQTCLDGEFGQCLGAVKPSPETCSATADEDCDGKDCNRWALIFGDENEQYPLDVATDKEGNFYVLGLFTGTLDFGDGNKLLSGSGFDMFLAKFDGLGAPIWAHAFPNPGFGLGQDIRGDIDVAPNGDLVVGGSFVDTLDFGIGSLISAGFTDVYVARFASEDGKALWNKRFGSSNKESLGAVGFDPQGDVLLAGTFQFGINFGGGNWTGGGLVDGFVVKLHGDTGALDWAQQLGGSGVETIEALAVDSAGSIVVGGWFSDDIKLCGSTLTVQAPSPGNLFVARFESQLGGCDWANQYAGSGQYRWNRAIVDSLGGAILTGNVSGTVNFGGETVTSAAPSGNSDIFVAKLSVFDGEYQWGKAFTSDDAKDTLWGLAVDNAGNIVLGVESEGSLSFGGPQLTSLGKRDIFLAKVAPDSTHLWSRRFGDMDEQQSPSVAVFPDGDILLAAEAAGTVDLGGGPLPCKGADLLLGRFAP